MHRDTLGYATVTETEMDTAVNPPTPVRATVHQYLNDNIFQAGLETSTLVLDPSNGGYIKGVRQTWALRDVRNAGRRPQRARDRGLARLFPGSADDQGGHRGGRRHIHCVRQSSTTNLTYDDLG